MPTLEWIGKSKVINHHQDVPFRVLERKYSFDENGQRDEDNGSENMIIRGDNLEALKALLPRYEGRVKCIYIDPPYNTGNEGWVYNDNVNDPKIKKWLGVIDIIVVDPSLVSCVVGRVDVDTLYPSFIPGQQGF